MKTINPTINQTSHFQNRLQRQVDQMDEVLDEHFQSIIYAERKKAEIETLMKVIALVIVVMSVAGLFKFFI